MTPSADNEQPFISHLIELRDRLLRIVMVVLVVFLALFPFSNQIYIWVAEPLMAHLPAGTSMIATEVASPFLTPMKLSLVAAIFFSMPFLLYQFWAFIAPGLYQHERKMVLPLVVSSTLLFYLGMAFAYFIVFPLVFAFLTGTAPEGVAVMTDIGRYLDFVLTLFFAFGVAFEIPIATIILVWMGVTTPENLAKKRPYVIVGTFVIGMLLTPPDVISQTLLAFPMWILFEFGIIFSKGFVRKREEDAEETPVATSRTSQSESVPAAAGGVGSTLDAMTVDDAESDDASGEKKIFQDLPEDYEPMSDDEMEAELDRIEAEEDAEEDAKQKPDDEADVEESAVEQDAAEDGSDDDDEGFDDDEWDEEAHEAEGLTLEEELVASKLHRIMVFRDAGEVKEARRLLYEVLAEGNDDQIMIAKNILEQLDED